MKLSRYVKVFPFDERSGYLLLYSTKKSSKILLKEDIFKAIEKDRLASTDKTLLSRLGMIVPDVDLEREEAIGMIDKINATHKTFNITVILNLDCNFSCVYCYENGLKGNYYMTDKTAGLLATFIKKNMGPAITSINIDFYGGEPLLSIRLIKFISKEMNSFAESRGARYSFTLVTNGSLFTRRIAKELTELGLKGIKTTLDGPPEIHNSSRPFKTGAGSFDAIIRNIKDTCEIVRIGIGGNYMTDNYGKFPLLLDLLEKEGLTPDKIHQIRFEAVMKNAGDLGHATEHSGGCMTINEPWVVQSSPLLREEILKRGFRMPKVAPTPCQIELHNAYVVNYDGIIYKCTSFIGRKSFEIGNIRTGITDQGKAYNPGFYKNDLCTECSYLPLCFGGCRYMAYVRHGNIHNVDCRKPYYDAALETLIKQDIKYNL